MEVQGYTVALTECRLGDVLAGAYLDIENGRFMARITFRDTGQSEFEAMRKDADVMAPYVHWQYHEIVGASQFSAELAKLLSALDEQSPETTAGSRSA
jgi:hypothetical protein